MQLGDVLMTSPLVKFTREIFPETEIHFMTTRKHQPLFVNNPNISKLWCWPSNSDILGFARLIYETQKQKFDVYIDLESKANTAILGYLLRIPLRIGYDRRGRNKFYNALIPETQGTVYSAEQHMNALKCLGIEPKLCPPECHPLDADIGKARNVINRLKRGRKIAAVSPVTRREEYKQWGADNFARVCDFLIAELGMDVLFLWGPGEEESVNAVRQRMKHQDLGNYDVMSILETVALLAETDMYIGNDNGLKHLAVCSGIPTYTIFGRPLAKNWTYPGTCKHKFSEFDPGCKMSCRFPSCGLECIRSIESLDVIEDLRKFIEQNHLN